MKIGIVTVYESITNLGSFLQAYALKQFLQKNGHEVLFIENIPVWKHVIDNLFKLNPKRELLLRQLKTIQFVRDMKLLPRISKDKIKSEDFDCLIYGSDEIWNIDNIYFRNGLFWGEGINDIPKIGYGISMGYLQEETLQMHPKYLEDIKSFTKVLVRDKRTYDILYKNGIRGMELVCDPTLLLPLEGLEQKISLPKDRYLLVYTYGLEAKWIKYIRKFAEKKHLKVISVCFWHPWADHIVECSALQFSKLIAGADYVFTTTFHGAVFTLLNHKRCCILPIREKVKDLVLKLNEEAHLVDIKSDFYQMEKTMEIEFDTETFEKKLSILREDSIKKFEGVLQCLGK